jgi:thymidylate kinase
MFTVALIGGDGAGKTTVAKHLMESLPWRVKYLYMGPSTVSGNVALPTTKLARFIKSKIDRNPESKGDKESEPGKPTSNELHYGKKKRNFLWIFARFLNRILEAYWRQLLTLTYRIRGFMVVYDRHILFDAAPRESSKLRLNKLLDRIEYWILFYLFPKPDLVIFLDASPDVLYNRKGEASVKHLKSRRQAMLEQGKRTKNFIRIDASLPLDQVLEEVNFHVHEYHESVVLKSK